MGYCLNANCHLDLLLTAMFVIPATALALALVFPVSSTRINGAQNDGQTVLQLDTINTQLVPLTLGVMSRCPDAILCESVIDKALKNVADKVDLSLSFIAKCVPSLPSQLQNRSYKQLTFSAEESTQLNQPMA